MMQGRLVGLASKYDIYLVPNIINSPVNTWYDLKQIATAFFSAGMHSGEVSLKHTKNPFCHL